MAYLSLYRKWRPQTFGEVVGQDHIVRTLANALQMGRVAHAYLFSGPRGTGKTTFARLLAKGLNCVQGPTGTPCNECDNCLRITSGNSVDVLEIDGASNRGIDEIRELRERVRYAPTEGSRKVYIIDEVHMLTNEAFNALLKVLEEPPPHVVFVFATTEAHKVPATILSRCQKFDFRRFSAGQLETHLKHVAATEGVAADADAIALIARHAEGGMRDALATMDQCLAADPERLSAETVTRVLGLVRRDALAGLVGHVLRSDLPAVLLLAHQLLDEGVEARQLIKDLATYGRDLALLKAAPEALGLVVASETDKELMKRQIEGVSIEGLLGVVDVFAAADTELRWATSPGMAVEITLARATMALDQVGSRSTANAADTEIVQALTRRLEVAEAAIRRLTAALAVSEPVPDSGGRQEAEEPGSSAPSRSEEAVVSGVQETLPKAGSVQPDLARLQALWPTVLNQLKEERQISTEAFLRVGVPGSISGSQVTIYFTPGHKFHQANIDDARHRTAVERAISRVIDRDVHIRTEIGEPPEMVMPTDGRENPDETAATSEPRTHEGDVLQSPAVQKALELLGGRITQIKERD